ncbi:nicotinate (nicotinamide) nucleotide adenylyltransferase [bacterium]|nr:nicotinate (nicotinamide) nucleotide adenylyltransferase [bacterium]
MRRAILGGTFDPPHIAHLVAAEAAHRDLAVDVVTFVPAGAPWQKAARDVSPASDRWEMTRLAVADIPHLEADDREVHRDGWTYTVDTLGTFAADDEITLILGADAAAGIRTWHRSDEVLARARIAVVPRPGTSLDLVTDVIGDVDVIDAPSLDISGTMIRARVGRGASIRFLVPDPVLAYIRISGLYA